MAVPATKVIMLDRGNNTTCTVNLHGATIVSWRVNNQEQLFVSKHAVFDGKMPISGGIPFIFPRFGPWPGGIPNGFASVSTWLLEHGPERLPSGDVEAIFSLCDNEGTCALWNYQLTYRMILREKELHLHVGIYNTGPEPFTFQLLLHTHFKVPDVRRCHITGLQGCNYIDRTRNGLLYQEHRETITINEWTDRVYQATPQEHLITNVVSGRKMRIQKFNLPDTVVWNPWCKKTKEMINFGNEEFPNMVCVEPGHISSPVLLPSGTVFEATQILQVM